MSAVMTDINVKYVIDFTLNTVRKNPEKYIKEIFGDAKLDPNAAFYGDRTIRDVTKWITTTNIPVSLGFELAPAQFPGVTVHLERSSPFQPYMGDAGMQYMSPLAPDERAVVVPAFTPIKVTPSIDQTYATVILPSTITDDQRQTIVPGLKFRDFKGQIFSIGEDKDDPTIIPDNTPLIQGDFQQLTVVSPYTDARYLENAMTFEEVALVTIYGHANRNEGLWLYMIVQWGLLKFRPLLISTFGMDLGMPSASDFAKDDSFLGENIWRRFITLSTKAVWSWEGPLLADAVAFVMGISVAPNSSPGSTGGVETSSPNPSSVGVPPTVPPVGP